MGKNLDCRWYEEQFPEPDQLVMVKVKYIRDLGAYADLLEYDNMEALILLSELSKRRIRSVQKLVKIGRKEVVMVLRVDQHKKYIDLSKRRVNIEEISKCEEKYNKAKAVNSIMRHVAVTLDLDLLELNKQITWPLYKTYGHAYDAFKKAVIDSDEIFAGLDMTPEVRECVLSNITRRLQTQAVRMRARIEVSCFKYEGVNVVREALLAGKAQSSDKVPLEVKLIASPQYVILTSVMDQELGLERVQAAMRAIEEYIKEAGGNFKILDEPKVVGDLEDLEREEDSIEDIEEGDEEEEEDEDEEEFQEKEEEAQIN